MRRVAAGVTAVMLAAVVGGLGPPRPPTARATTCDVGSMQAGTRWRGRYTCGQGLTELTLSIRSVRGRRVDAIFDFDWRRGGIRGRFVLSGVIAPETCRLRLTPVRWLEQPPGWVMVTLDGVFGKARNVYAGRVTPETGGRTCTTFSVTRQP